MKIAKVNRMSRDAFVAAFGGVFEHSPWVAERAFVACPFVDADALHAAMMDVVNAATRDEQLALLRAHPDLAGKEARAGTMTNASVAEQASAALDRLLPAEMARIADLNAAYRAMHGFPFIIAVRHYTRDGILHEFARRLTRDSENEIAENLRQILAITRMRLSRMFDHVETGSAAAEPTASSTAANPHSSLPA